MKRLLLVDDDRPLRAALVRALKFDYEIHEASDGREALVIALNLLSYGRPPDVILTDYDMPHMTGGELWTELGKASVAAGSSPGVEASLVLMSGSAQGMAFAALHDIPALAKPFGNDAARSLLRHLCDPLWIVEDDMAFLTMPSVHAAKAIVAEVQSACGSKLERDGTYVYVKADDGDALRDALEAVGFRVEQR